MPLSMADKGQRSQIRKIGGQEKTRRFLGNLGFVEGADVTVISELAGNVIVEIKDARVAIDKKMASNILVS